jgi:hypothetical protein
MTSEDNVEIEPTLFSSDDWQMFFAMQDNPPETTERMKKAALAYKKLFDNDED